MFKKAIILLLVILYLYTLSLDIFLNNYFRVPTPVIFGLPLVLLFKEEYAGVYHYWKEILFLFLAIFIYYIIGSSDYKSFTVDLSVIIVCSLYFNYFVGRDAGRLKLSVLIFCLILGFSTVVMLLNHLYPVSMVNVRELLLGGNVIQSPSGIASSIFSFGYQVAPFATLILIFSLIYNKPLLVKAALLIFCLIGLYFGLQRSAFVTFVIAVFLFVLFYYRSRSVLILASGLVLGGLIYSFVLKEESENYDNIFTKNEQKQGENREGLMTENLKVIADYPYGLLFHGANWTTATRNNPMFANGLTSHNAYLMFITYLGPFLGLLLLFLIYKKVFKIFRYAVLHIRDKENALLVCLCFAFLAVSLNSMFHNAWLLNGNGPTIFLYFAILQLGNEPALSEVETNSPVLS